MNNQFIYDFSLMPQYIEKLMSKMKIAIIFGGSKEKENAVMYKTHNPRSWKSYEVVAQDIKKSLEQIGFKHLFFMPDDMTMQENLKKNNIHMAWLNTGGVQGYESMSHTAGILEMMGIPYVGHSPLNACRMDNKHVLKRELIHIKDIKTPDFMVCLYPNEQALSTFDKKFSATFKNYQGPFVVKPVSGRASVHVYLVDTKDEVLQTIKTVFDATCNDVIIEKYLSGKEYCVSVAGPVIYSFGTFKKLDTPFAFSEVERIMDKNERIFTSMDKKAITTERIRLIPSDDPLKKTLNLLGQTLYTAFNIRSIIRLDLRADENGEVNVLEINPKPDLKKTEADTAVTSISSVGLAEHGMNYNDLILSLISDRIDYLLAYRYNSVKHIAELLS